MWAIAALFFFNGVGLANVMPPATESIMASVPREKAGVGSAVGNTIRQVGGALGVAVLGSVLSAVYRNSVAGDLAGLPAAARTTAGESIAGGYAVAGRLGGAAGGAIVRAADSAFVHAMHYAAFGSAVVAVLGALVVLAWLPRQSAPHAAPAPAPVDALGEQLELAEAA